MCNFFFFKQKTAYEMRITDWSSDVCSSDLDPRLYDADQRAEALGVYGAADHAPAFIAALAPTSPAASVGIGVGKIGRASCRERVCQYGYISGVAVSLTKNIHSKHCLHANSHTILL